MSRHYRQATQGVSEQSTWVGITWSVLTHRDRQTADRGFPALGFADSLMSASAWSTMDEIYGGECISKNAYQPRQGLMLAQAIVEFPMQSKGV